MKKRAACCIVVLLAVCIAGGVIYVASQRETVNNEIFTDELFEGMAGIVQFGVPLYPLSDDDEQEAISCLQSLRLEPAEGRTADFPIQNEGLVGGYHGYCIYYEDEDKAWVHFCPQGTSLLFEDEYYYVLDKNGEPTEDCADTLWYLFHPELKS